MNSGLPLQTTAIFFLVNLYIKQGIRSDYVMVDFIWMGLLDLNWELQNEKSFPQCDANPRPSTYEANLLSIALLVEISIEHLNVDRALPECAIKI